MDVDGGRRGYFEGGQGSRCGIDAVGLLAQPEEPQRVGGKYLPLDTIVEIGVEHQVERGPHRPERRAGGVEHPVWPRAVDEQLDRARRREPRRVGVDVVVLLQDGQDLVEHGVEGACEVEGTALGPRWSPRAAWPPRR